MKAIIMAGGMGTRLQPLTKRIPKPMVPLLDRPVMEYIVELLRHHGISDIAVTLGYKPEAIRQHFQDGCDFGVRISYAVEEFPLGTAGGVKNLESYLNQPFVVMSGDGLTDFDLGEAMKVHRAHGGLATLLLTTVACPKGYGVVKVDDRGYIEQFVEKPESWIDGIPYLINTGIYILDPAILHFIPSGVAYDFGRELFPKLLKSGIPLYGHVASGYWSDIGTLHQYYQTQLDMVSGRVNVRMPDEVRPALTM